ncbi:hypothetical protein GX51_02891 [Blastomyces parvus]|uniref:Uncharacterized protein n=1 Tax=Blastomyces parvus TaxID=2060905 RepID=A0A2B7X9Z5_9EURO|nr:hypothetical protein GX51_02891 [Blastomyces parvus]
MRSCSDTEPEEDDTTARRCSYCGRFGKSESIVKETGLCHTCHENVHSSTKNEVASLMTGKNGGGPSSVAAAVMLRMAAVDVNDDSSSIRSITSIHSDQEDNEDEDEEGSSSGDGGGDGDAGEKRTYDGRKLRGSGRDVSNNTGTESNLCARCWNNPSTTILYNTPICNECYRIAQEKREHTKGTKKRFQPPTPHLQPGKRLTRVCDSCRRKRKRCQHRRVVDENDPDADLRRKRSRSERTSTETNNRAGRSSTSSSSVIEVNDMVIVSEAEREPMVTPHARTTTTTASNGTCAAKASTTSTNGAMPAKATASSSSPHAPAPRNNESYSASNLRRAIEGSVHVVFSREMDRLVGAAEEKLADAASALDDVKAHMAAWLGCVKRVYNLTATHMGLDKVGD